MNRLPLDVLASRLAAQLHCGQEDLCLQIMKQVTRGKPVAQTALSTTLQINRDELEQRLAQLPDTEFDEQGNIVGWGVTLVPTPHHFQIRGQPLFTWCAFDTVLFPPSLQADAQVQSTCLITGKPIAFVVTSEGVIEELTPAEARLSLILPEQRSDCVRATFCMQSLFFESEQAASAFLTAHPEAFLLSLEEAAYVGRLVAQTRLADAHRDAGTPDRASLS
ncbi:MAG: organomercurial lyase MerB [Ktedonobacteraceae bacterium]